MALYNVLFKVFFTGIFITRDPRCNKYNPERGEGCLIVAIVAVDDAACGHKWCHHAQIAINEEFHERRRLNLWGVQQICVSRILFAVKFHFLQNAR